MVIKQGIKHFKGDWKNIGMASEKLGRVTLRWHLVLVKLF